MCGSCDVHQEDTEGGAEAAEQPLQGCECRGGKQEEEFCEGYGGEGGEEVGEEEGAGLGEGGGEG